jgi:hypothetical protein
MSRRVYRFGMRPPVDGEALVRSQLRAARDYRNDLVAIERGRRHALRLIDDTPEVRDAEAIVRAATKSNRKVAIATLRDARKAARAARAEELTRISDLDAQIRRDARAITACYWGTYLDIEAAHMQARGAPLYEEDALTPNDPRFVYTRTDGFSEGQLGIQLQATRPITTGGVWGSTDTRVRLEDASAFASELDKHGRPRANRGRKAILALRIGSIGRNPVWARWPIWVHREVPNMAQWKWVRVSVRLEGPHERWSCEITVDDPAPPPRTLDTALMGAIAVEWSWDTLQDDMLRVASWADTNGESGEIVLPDRIVHGLVKASSIRAVRDMLAEDARPKIGKAIERSQEKLPLWLARAGQWIPLSKSPMRLHDLLRRWTTDRIDACREGYELLRAWADRDVHLWEYETGVRHGTLGARLDIYRVLARRWSERYRRVLLSDQDLSREARCGDEGTARFRAGCGEFRDALRNAFGPEDAIDARWRDAPAEEDERSWCERTRDAWIAGGARGDGRFAKLKEKNDNAWAERKLKAEMKRQQVKGSREPSATPAE